MSWRPDNAQPIFRRHCLATTCAHERIQGYLFSLACLNSLPLTLLSPFHCASTSSFRYSLLPFPFLLYRPSFSPNHPLSRSSPPYYNFPHCFLSLSPAFRFSIPFIPILPLCLAIAIAPEEALQHLSRAVLLAALPQSATILPCSLDFASSPPDRRREFFRASLPVSFLTTALFRRCQLTTNYGKSEIHNFRDSPCNLVAAFKHTRIIFTANCWQIPWTLRFVCNWKFCYAMLRLFGCEEWRE